MATWRRYGPASRPLALGLTAGVLLAGTAAVLGERGAFHRADRVIGISGIPGATIEDDGADAPMPVVTSLRSGGEAARHGLRVGDRIDEIDGRPVRDAADLRRVMIADGADRPIALHVRRGDAVWTVAIDRSEPPPGRITQHDPEDTAR